MERGAKKRNYSPLHLWRGAGGEVKEFLFVFVPLPA